MRVTLSPEEASALLEAAKWSRDYLGGNWTPRPLGDYRSIPGWADMNEARRDALLSARRAIRWAMKGQEEVAK